MTEPLTFSNFFSDFYILHPFGEEAEKKLSNDDRIWACAYSVILGACTFGLVHFGCWIAEKCIKLTDASDQKVQRESVVGREALYQGSEKSNARGEGIPPPLQPIVSTQDALKKISEDKKRILPKNIPPQCDVRGTKCITNGHITNFVNDYLKRENSKDYLAHFGGVKDTSQSIDNRVYIDTEIKKRPLLPIPNLYLITLPNHWALVRIRPEKGTIEYYDSMVEYGDYKQTRADLEELGKKLDQHYPANTNTSYRVVPKVPKRLQFNSYDCGLWVICFVMLLTENPDIDLKKLDVKQLQDKIAKLRLDVTLRLIELCEENPSILRDLTLSK